MSLTDGRDDSAKQGSIGALFRDGLGVDILWLWLPTMLTTQGRSPALAGMGLTADNFGGVIGAIHCALAMTRFGSRWPMIIWAYLNLPGGSIIVTVVGLSMIRNHIRPVR